MKQNVCGFDRIVRILIGMALVAWGAFALNGWGAVGAIPLLTGLAGWCPLYRALGWTPCEAG